MWKIRAKFVVAKQRTLIIDMNRTWTRGLSRETEILINAHRVWILRGVVKSLSLEDMLRMQTGAGNRMISLDIDLARVVISIRNFHLVNFASSWVRPSQTWPKPLREHPKSVFQAFLVSLFRLKESLREPFSPLRAY